MPDLTRPQPATEEKTMPRSVQRIEFLTDVLTTAIESYGYGWFEVLEYSPGLDDADEHVYALIKADDTGETYRVDLDLIARGLAAIRDMGHGPGGPGNRRNIMLADRTNGDDGDFDVVDTLAVVEVALFGEVVYA